MIIRMLRAATAVIAIYVPAMALSADGGHFNLTEVADGIYVHQGQHVGLDDPGHADIANIGFIVGEECVAVIDTGGSAEVGQALRTSIGAVTRLPICYVINTHVHFDHILGNLAFKDDAPKFAGHTRLVAAVEANRQFFLERFGDDLGADATVDSIISPTLLIEDTMELELGGRTLVLTAYKKAHTGQDLTVLDRKTRTLWLADLLFMERIPVLDGSLKGWIAVLQGLQGIEVSHVIPGHGPPIADWPEAMAGQRRYLETLLEETRAKIAQGAALDEAQERIGLSEKDCWLLFDGNHKRNVARAFAELEWE